MMKWSEREGMRTMTEQIGIRLKQLRKQYNYTQKDIADFLDISQSLVAKIENGERNLKMTQLHKLCNLYVVSPEYILYGEGEPPKLLLFKKDNKKISLETISKMNKIILNLQEMQTLAEKHNIK